MTEGIHSIGADSFSYFSAITCFYPCRKEAIFYGESLALCMRAGCLPSQRSLDNLRSVQSSNSFQAKRFSISASPEREGGFCRSVAAWESLFSVCETEVGTSLESCQRERSGSRNFWSGNDVLSGRKLSHLACSLFKSQLGEATLDIYLLSSILLPRAQGNYRWWIRF